MNGSEGLEVACHVSFVDVKLGQEAKISSWLSVVMTALEARMEFVHEIDSLVRVLLLWQTRLKQEW
jgi:hypothetical protein